MKIGFLALVFLWRVATPLDAYACSAKPFSGRDWRSGKVVSIDPKQNPKGTVVVFVSSECPCSRSHEAALTRLSQDFPEVKFVAVNSNLNENDDATEQHFKTGPFTFPVLRDVDTKIANEFGALKTPHAFVVGPKGECWFDGGIDDTRDAAKAKKHFLRAALTDLKEGREPKEKQARTLGCIIQR